MTTGFRYYYDKPLQYLIDEELIGYSNLRQATRSAKQRLRMYANLYLRDLRKEILTESSVCGRCGCENKLCLDHIIPISKGGENKLVNIQVLCQKCNILKRDKLTWQE